MSSPTSAITASTAKTTPMKYHRGIPTFKPAKAIKPTSASQGEILTTSKTWANAAYQEKQQRQRQAQLALHKRTKTQQQMGRQVVEKGKCQLDAVWREFPSSKALPGTLNERLDEEKALANMKHERLERSRMETESRIKAQKLVKGSYGYTLIEAFGGKLPGGINGAVLNVPTIWRAHAQEEIDLTLVEWPKPAEFSYEGREREASRENFGRRLPIVRNWTQEFEPKYIDAGRHSHDEKDMRSWERFMALQPHEFDTLHDHTAPLHWQIYPFGEGCPVPKCEACRSHRAVFGLNTPQLYQGVVDEYKMDMSPARMENCLPRSLLAALNDQDN